MNPRRRSRCRPDGLWSPSIALLDLAGGGAAPCPRRWLRRPPIKRSTMISGSTSVRYPPSAAIRMYILASMRRFRNDCIVRQRPGLSIRPQRAAGSGLPQTLIEHWNGARWSVVAGVNPYPGTNELVSVRALSASNVWAVGRGSNDPNGLAITAALIEHWNGRSWSAVRPPTLAGTPDELASISGSPTSGLWADSASSGSRAPLAESFNGTARHRASAPTTSGGENVLESVAAPGSREA